MESARYSCSILTNFLFIRPCLVQVSNIIFNANLSNESRVVLLNRTEIFEKFPRNTLFRCLLPLEAHFFKFWIVWEFLYFQNTSTFIKSEKKILLHYFCHLSVYITHGMLRLHPDTSKCYIYTILICPALWAQEYSGQIAVSSCTWFLWTCDCAYEVRHTMTHFI